MLTLNLLGLRTCIVSLLNACLILQDLAIKLRAQGKVYKPQKAKKTSSKADKGNVSNNHAAQTKHFPGHQPQQQQQQQQSQQAAPQREETGSRPKEYVQVKMKYPLRTCFCALDACKGHAWPPGGR